jgi:DNA polymerase-3 subunit alpha (Gram-positive type)
VSQLFNQRLPEALAGAVKQIRFEKQKNALTLHLEPEEILAYEERKQLYFAMRKDLEGLRSLNFDIDYRRLVSAGDAWVEQNLENLRAELKDKEPALLSFFEKCRVRTEGRLLEIQAPNQVVYATLEQDDIVGKLQRIYERDFQMGPEIHLTKREEGESPELTLEAFKAKKIDEHLKAIEEQAQAVKKKPRGQKAASADEDVLFGKPINRPAVTLGDPDAVHEGATVAFHATVFDIAENQLKNGKTLMSLSVTDGTGSISIKMFLKKEEYARLSETVHKGGWYLFDGSVRYDTFDKELSVYAYSIERAEAPPVRTDDAEEKRVEFHLHTNMSDMDGITPPEKLIERAIEWGHEAVAITDHGGVQAFPAAARYGDKIKILYGVEGYLINDAAEIIKEERGQTLDDTFVVFDIETTGLSFSNDRITEIGAVKVEKGAIVDRFSALVDPERPLSQEIIELTGLTDEMLKGQPTIDRVLPDFLDFCGKAALVAHNAAFDIAFIRENADRLDLSFSPTIVDTLSLSRLLLKKIRRHKLNTVAKHLKISLDNHHRAEDDAQATAEILLKFFVMLREKEITTLAGINNLALEQMDYKSMKTYHVVIFAKDQAGVKALYKLISDAHIHTFYRHPRIPKSALARVREHLVIGSACESGELYSALRENATEEDLEKIAAFYDYLEIQPLDNNRFLIEKGLVKDEAALIAFNEKIIALGDRLGIPVIATGDVHFLDPEDGEYRKILMAGKGFGDAEDQPPLYLRTTEEMLAAFSYLDEETRRRVVIEAPRALAASFDKVAPIPSGTFPPKIEGSDEELRTMCHDKAVSIYGDPLPEVVETRLNRELDSIIKNGYSVMYIIAQKLVTKSLEDGFLVGSRGSVGSSLAATMSDITEVNPLPPHYVCPSCRHSEFFLNGEIANGADLPKKNCPHCGHELTRDGHDIPFETFLGFDGDKEPDIDLNFAGVYQAVAHRYTEELFGEGYTFKAGTIGTIADKTAYGFVRNYFNERDQIVHSKEIDRLTRGCVGVKRTTGQHPGGIMVVPSDKDIYDFTPIQRPANDVNSDILTTHFDYHSISGKILKLDILGHDVPTIIKYLEEMTGVDVFKIPLGDPDVLKIFTSVDPLKIVDPEYKADAGSLGIPEFGTRFVRQMLEDTKPKTFSDLVRISGLSHGTDVWLNNAQELVRKNTVTIKDVISTRDDIMNYLLQKGLEPLKAFKIMEKVRKGKGLTEEDEALMKEHGVPDWYIWSCKTIKYMFPKAHAVAYVMMSVRIAYFKVHHPLAFYATYFTTKVEDFDADLICRGKEAVKAERRRIAMLEKATKKEQDFDIILEISEEYFARGFDFHKVDLYRSEAERFTLVDGKILPPLRALQGVGEKVAYQIVEERKNGSFLSIEDLRIRTKSTKTVIEALENHGCISDLSERNQLSFF